MKKIILTNSAILLIALGFAQANFKWEKIDSAAKTKAQIYSDTKMFIAEYWKSAQNVIQNDDKDAGMILVKGNINESTTSVGVGVPVEWHYSYTIKFLIKEGRYKIVIENVNCESSIWYGKPNLVDCLAPCDSCDFPGFGRTGLNKAKYVELLTSLKNDLQSIVDSYEKYIKTPSVSNGDW